MRTIKKKSESISPEFTECSEIYLVKKIRTSKFASEKQCDHTHVRAISYCLVHPVTKEFISELNTFFFIFFQRDAM